MSERLMGKGHELNPLAAALCASLGLALFVASGFSCSFLDIVASDNDLLVILETSEQAARRSSSIGILCQGDFYSLEDDFMWSLSRIFFFVSASLGVVACLLAWAIATFARPSSFAWQVLSIISAVISVIQVPMFILFEVEPCTDYKMDQKCTLSSGAFLCMASVASWFLVTLITQLLDPPAWVNNLDYWRARKPGSMCSLRTRDMLAASASSIEEDEGQTSDKVALLGPMHRWMQRRQWAATEETFCMDEEEGGAAISSAHDLARKGPDQAARRHQEPFTRNFALAPPPSSTATDTVTDTAAKDDANESFETDQPVVSGVAFTTTSQGPKEKLLESPLGEIPRPEKTMSFQSVSTPMKNDSIALQAAPIVMRLPPESPESPVLLVRDEPMSLQGPDGSETPLDEMQTTPALVEAKARSTPVIIPIITQPISLFEDTNPPASSAKANDALTPARSRKSPQIEDDSLGSLVSKVTGTESVLDNPVVDITFDSSASPEQRVEPPTPGSNLREKAWLAATLVEKLNIAKARARARRGYRSMDDSQIGSFFPTSPPFEIMVNMDENDGSFLYDSKAKSGEKAILGGPWDKLYHVGSLLDHHDDKLIGEGKKPSRVSSNISLPQLGSDGEPEPMLHFSDDSDDDDDVDTYGSKMSRSFGDSALSGESGSSQGSPTSKGSKTLRVKRRRKRKKRKTRSTASVASSPSLLDTVIAEETVEDLEGETSNHAEDARAFDPYTSSLPLKRSLSAPNLAAFAAGAADDSRFAIDLVMAGMRSYQRVETSRRNASTESSQSSSVDLLPKDSERLANTSVSRKPTFKEERDMRAGIHAPESVSSDSSSQDERSAKTSPSRRSREARIARLRKQRSTQSKTTPRARSVDPPIERLSSSSLSRPIVLPPRPPPSGASHQRQAAPPSSPLLSVLPPSNSVDTAINSPPSLASLRAASTHDRSSSVETARQRTETSSMGSQAPSPRPAFAVHSRSYSADEIPREKQPEPTSPETASVRSWSDDVQGPLERRALLADDTNEIMLDAMDLSLAEVQRPHGAEYGPDEVSL